MIVLLFRKVHVLDLVLDQEAAPDPESDLTPGLALVHDHGANAPNLGHVPDHDHARHGAGHVLSPARSRGHDPAQDPHANPNHDHDLVHVPHLDHPEMKKKHLLNLKQMRIRITIQQMVTLSLSELLFLSLPF